MIKRFLALFLFFNCAIACAQTIKTDVLVIGGSPSGVAAAMQCARSKVKTVLIVPDTCIVSFDPGSIPSNTAHLSYTIQGVGTIRGDRDLLSGIWTEFRKRYIDYHKKQTNFDTTYNALLNLDSYSSPLILKMMADTVKNLTINYNSVFDDIKKDGDRWDVTMTQNGKTEIIKARVVIDATVNGIVLLKAGATYSTLDSIRNKADSKLYRTSIAMGGGFSVQSYNDITAVIDSYPAPPSYIIPIKAIVAKGVDNLLIAERLFSANVDMYYLPKQLTLGQGVGVIAAYCAFFKTTTANLNVRVIQGELLDFKGYMLPFNDISTDPYWRAIQQVCATGMLKGVQKVNGKKAEFLFMPDSIVTTAEVKPYLLEIYTRAFLWFNREKPGEKFTVGNLLSFMSELTLTDPDNMRKSISKAWSTQYKFTSPFDVDRPITRREFAILANKYLNPFARTVDLDGRMVN